MSAVNSSYFRRIYVPEITSVGSSNTVDIYKYDSSNNKVDLFITNATATTRYTQAGGSVTANVIVGDGFVSTNAASSIGMYVANNSVTIDSTGTTIVGNFTVLDGGSNVVLSNIQSNNLVVFDHTVSIGHNEANGSTPSNVIRYTSLAFGPVQTLDGNVRTIAVQATNDGTSNSGSYKLCIGTSENDSAGVVYSPGNTQYLTNTSTVTMCVNSIETNSIAVSGEGNFGSVNTSNLSSTTITTTNLTATNGNIVNLVSSNGVIDNLITINGNISNLNSNSINTTDLVAVNGNISTLLSNLVSTVDLVATTGNITTVNATNVYAAFGNIVDLTTLNFEVTNFATISNASITNLAASWANITNLVAPWASISNLNTDNIYNSGNIYSDNIITNTLTTGSFNLSSVTNPITDPDQTFNLDNTTTEVGPSLVFTDSGNAANVMRIIMFTDANSPNKPGMAVQRSAGVSNWETFQTWGFNDPPL